MSYDAATWAICNFNKLFDDYFIERNCDENTGLLTFILLCTPHWKHSKYMREYGNSKYGCDITIANFHILTQFKSWIKTFKHKDKVIKELERQCESLILSNAEMKSCMNAIGVKLKIKLKLDD